MRVAGLLNEVRKPDVHAPNCSVTEWGALKPWLVKSVKESDSKVPDHSTHLQRALTRYGGTEQDMATVDEDKEVRGRGT